MNGRLRKAGRAAVLGGIVACLLIWLAVAAGPYRDASIHDVVLFAPLFAPLLAVVVVGALITVRRPEAPLGWLFLAIGALMSANAAGGALGTVAAATGSRAWWATVAAAVAAVSWPLTFALLTSFLVLLFPDGLPSARWRPVAWLAGTASVVVGAAALAPPTFALTTSTGILVANPIAWRTASQADQIMGTSLMVCVLIGLISLVALILRLRRADDVLRLQLRWATAALVLVVLSLLAPSWMPGMSSSFNPYAVVALTLLFVALGVAITRYHLYDIDRVISRTASYAIVTGLLIAVYAGIVVSAGRLLHTSSPVVVAAATLAAAAIARPALRRVQNAVDRRFNRARYDARLVVDGYGERLRSQAAPEHVADGLISAVARAVEPSSVTVWVRR